MHVYAQLYSVTEEVLTHNTDAFRADNRMADQHKPCYVSVETAKCSLEGE